jgi:hypothetical protein
MADGAPGHHLSEVTIALSWSGVSGGCGE